VTVNPTPNLPWGRKRDREEKGTYINLNDAGPFFLGKEKSQGTGANTDAVYLY
jgi:hypothetical protein